MTDSPALPPAGTGAPPVGERCRPRAPDFRIDGYAGHLIAIEGIDGSGRSTHIALLSEWLEMNGFSVETTGLRRSALLAKTIDDAIQRNVATNRTLALMYATDFYDQMENRILPALRAGSVVLADRYVYTLTARFAVRGIERNYIEGIYALAPKPGLTFWLDVPPAVAFDREFGKSNAVSYWEAGRDMNLSMDIYESFTRYQNMLRRELKRIAKAEGFRIVRGTASIRSVNRTLRQAIGEHLGIRDFAFRFPRAGAPREA